MSQPFHKGWLLQQKDSTVVLHGGLNKDDNHWKKRYYILKDDVLLVFYNPRDEKPHAQIHLRGASMKTISQDNKSRKKNNQISFIFSLATPSRTFLFQAAFQEELDEWVSALTFGIDFANNNSSQYANTLVKRQDYGSTRGTSRPDRDGGDSEHINKRHNHFLDQYNIPNYLTSPQLVPPNLSYYAQQGWNHSVNSDQGLTLWRSNQALMANTNSFAPLFAFTQKPTTTWKTAQPHANAACAHNKYDFAVIAGGMTSNYLEIVKIRQQSTLQQTDVDFEYYCVDNDDSDNENNNKSKNNSCNKNNPTNDTDEDDDDDMDIPVPNLDGEEKNNTTEKPSKLLSLTSICPSKPLNQQKKYPLFSTSFRGFRQIDLYNTSTWSSQQYNELFLQYPLPQTIISSLHTIQIPSPQSLPSPVGNRLNNDSRPEYFKKNPAMTSMAVGVTWVNDICVVGTTDELLHIYRTPSLNSGDVASTNTNSSRFLMSNRSNSSLSTVTTSGGPQNGFLKENTIEEHIYAGAYDSGDLSFGLSYQHTLANPFVTNANNFPLASDYVDYGLSSLSLCPTKYNMLSTLSYSTLSLFELDNPTPIVTSQSVASVPITSHAWSYFAVPKIAVGGARGAFKILDPRTLKTQGDDSVVFINKTAINTTIVAIANNPLFPTLWATAGLDGVICVWDERFPGAPLLEFTSPSTCITTLTWSASHIDWLHAGYADGTVSAFNLRTPPYFHAHSTSLSKDPIIMLAPSKTIPMSAVTVDQSANTGFLHYKPAFVDKFVWGAKPPELYDVPANKHPRLANTKGTSISARSGDDEETREDAWLQPYLTTPSVSSKDKNNISDEDGGTHSTHRSDLTSKNGTTPKGEGKDGQTQPTLATISKHAERLIVRLMYVRDWSGVYSALCSVLDILWQHRQFDYATALLKRLSTRHTTEQISKWRFWSNFFLMNEIGTEHQFVSSFTLPESALGRKRDGSGPVSPPQPFDRSFSLMNWQQSQVASEKSGDLLLAGNSSNSDNNNTDSSGADNNNSPAIFTSRQNPYNQAHIQQLLTTPPTSNQDKSRLDSTNVASTGTSPLSTTFYNKNGELDLTLPQDAYLYGRRSLSIKFIFMLHLISTYSPPLTSIALTQPISIHDRRIEFLKLRLMLHFFYQSHQWLPIFTLRKQLCTHLDFSGELLTRQESYNRFMQRQQQQLLVQQAKGQGSTAEKDAADSMLSPSNILMDNDNGLDYGGLLPDELIENGQPVGVTKGGINYNPLKLMVGGIQGTVNLFAAGGNFVLQGIKQGGNLLGLTHSHKVALNNQQFRGESLQLLYSLRPVLDASMLNKAILAVAVYDHVCAVTMAVMIGNTLKQNSQFSLFSTIALALLSPTIYYTNIQQFDYGVDSTAVYFKNKILALEQVNACPHCGLSYGLSGAHFTAITANSQACPPIGNSANNSNMLLTPHRKSLSQKADTSKKRHKPSDLPPLRLDSSRDYSKPTTVDVMFDSEATDSDGDGYSHSGSSHATALECANSRRHLGGSNITRPPQISMPHSLFPFSLDSDNDEDDEDDLLMNDGNHDSRSSISHSAIQSRPDFLKTPTHEGGLGNPFSPPNGTQLEPPMFFNPADDIKHDITSLVTRMKIKQEKSKMTVHAQSTTTKPDPAQAALQRRGSGLIPTTEQGTLNGPIGTTVTHVAPELKLKAQSSCDRDLRNPKIVLDQLQALLELFLLIRQSELSRYGSSVTKDSGKKDTGTYKDAISDVSTQTPQGKFKDILKRGKLDGTANINLNDTPVYAGDDGNLMLTEDILFDQDDDEAILLRYLPHWQKFPIWNPYRRIFYTFDCTTCKCSVSNTGNSSNSNGNTNSSSSVYTTSSTSTTTVAKKIVKEYGRDGVKETTIDLDRLPPSFITTTSSAPKSSGDNTSVMNTKTIYDPDFDGSISSMLGRGCTPIIDVVIQHPRNILKLPKMPKLTVVHARKIIKIVEDRHPATPGTSILTGITFLLYLHSLSTIDHHERALYMASTILSIYNGLPFAKAIEHRLNSTLVSSALEYLENTCTRDKYNLGDVGKLHNGACSLLSIIVKAPYIPPLLETNIPQLFKRLTGEISEVLTFIATDPNYVPDGYNIGDDDVTTSSAVATKRRIAASKDPALIKAKQNEAMNKANALASAISQILKRPDDKGTLWDTPSKPQPFHQYAPYYRTLLSTLSDLKEKWKE